MSGAHCRWESLVDLATKLRREEVDLDELTAEINKKQSEKINSTNSSCVQLSVSCRGTFKKPRNREVEEQGGSMSEEGRKILSAISNYYENRHLRFDRKGERKPIKEVIQDSVDLGKEINKEKSEKSGLDLDRRIGTSPKTTCFDSRKVLNSTCIQDSTFEKRVFGKRNREVEEESRTKTEKRRKILSVFPNCDGRIDCKGERKPIKKIRAKINSGKKVIFKKTELVLTEEIKKSILDRGGCEESVVSVIDKNLYQSDVSPNLCRFSIPYGKVNEQFVNKLLEAEVRQLDSNMDGVPVTLFVGDGDARTMTLKNWQSNTMYALVGGWKDVCHDYGLKVGQPVQLWCFRRRNLELCFALVLAGKEED